MRLARPSSLDAAEPDPLDSPTAKPHKPRLGERLIARGLLTQDQLAVALRQQRANPRLIGQILVEAGFVSEPDLIDTLAEAHGFERVHLSQLIIEPALIEMVPREVAVVCRALPVTHSEDTLLLAMVDVFDLPAFDRIRRYLPFDLDIQPAVVAQSELDEAIQLYYGPPVEDAIASDARPGVVRMLNAIISEAVQLGASDLHFEPEGLFVRLRCRLDGNLTEIRTFHADDWPAVNVRLKIMAGMNIADTRRPQDGRFSFQIRGREVDFRVAAHPTVHGENIVIRILDKARSLVPLDRLGYTPGLVEQLKLRLRRPEGIVVVTGPTGSGKTTTLYSMLGFLNQPGVNIMTLEEPVEYQIARVRQSTAREAHGMGFAEGVRSILRQDPDIILIGEVRDQATAQMALRSAMTGHQVFTTLHTNDALGVIPRLVDLGLHPAMIAGNIICVLAQRLVRKLCPHCRYPRPATAEERRILRQPEKLGLLLYESRGCPDCRQTGCKGRVAVGEILPFTRELDELVAVSATAGQIRQEAARHGFVPMAEDGIVKVLAGEISLAELCQEVDMTEALLA